MTSIFIITSWLIGMAGDALQQRLEALVQLGGGRRLGRQPPLLRLRAGQRVARQQQPLGPHRADPGRPQRRRRRAPDTRRRVADLGVVGDHQQVGAERHVGAAGDAVAVHLAEHRLLGVKEAHEAAHVAPHELEVGDRIPVRLRHVVGADRRRVERRARRRLHPLQPAHIALGRSNKVVATAEARPVAGQRDRMNPRIEIRPLHAGRDLSRHQRRNPIAPLRPIQALCAQPDRRSHRLIVSTRADLRASPGRGGASCTFSPPPPGERQTILEKVKRNPCPASLLRKS